ncbi:MAG: dTDP-4-dehydrorhamnose 3,5-epimerase [Flavobacteriaceae bacterium]
MQIEETKLSGCFLVTPDIHKDGRGYFMETYRQSWTDALGEFTGDFVQDNQSFSHYGTIRGLHFQTGEHAQAKWVRVLFGKILDVAVDLRSDSPTYGQYIAVELSAAKHNQLWIPKGFAHGFSVLSQTAVVCYKCDAYYNKEAESGIHPLDRSLNIDWGIPTAKQRISARDLALPSFNDFTG